jgi:hypothetical protein
VLYLGVFTSFKRRERQPGFVAKLMAVATRSVDRLGLDSFLV